MPRFHFHYSPGPGCTRSVSTCRSRWPGHWFLMMCWSNLFDRATLCWIFRELCALFSMALGPLWLGPCIKMMSPWLDRSRSPWSRLESRCKVAWSRVNLLYWFVAATAFFLCAPVFFLCSWAWSMLVGVKYPCLWWSWWVASIFMLSRS